ncbi:MAG: hypothetical protein M1828_001073 [Chrysothrix sp. TS-e1954]|nr:MAG: hypothetical protein M1828_001073 [Chrysothrix sp. TS-e1954]
MTTWLKGQRKAELVDLADEADLKGANAMKKDDLVIKLDERLKANQAKYGKTAAFSQYYGTSAFNKPTSHEMNVAPDPADVKPAKSKSRRQTTGTAESSTDVATSTSSAVANRTPRALSNVAVKIPLPASPKEVSAMVDRHTASISRRVSTYVEESGVEAYMSDVRTGMSTIQFIQLFFIVLEAWGLSRETLPWRLAFTLTVPFSQYLGFKDSVVPVSFPDFFVLLTSRFWAPSLLWVAVSIVIPLSVAWLVNMTSASGVSRKHVARFDPLTYSVAKAITTYLVFTKGLRFYNFVSEITVDIVNATLPGGSTGMQIGAAVCGVYALYDAVLRK